MSPHEQLLLGWKSLETFFQATLEMAPRGLTPWALGDTPQTINLTGAWVGNSTYRFLSDQVTISRSRPGSPDPDESGLARALRSLP